MEELNLVVFLILVVSLCVLYWHERRIHRIRLNQLTSQVESLGKNIAELRQREKVIFQASQRFVEASCEHEIIDQVLHLTIDITGASGASFVALDERGQPQASKRLGEFPFPIPEAWLEYLASPSIRHGCQECKNLGILMKTCPLLKGPFSDAYGLYCLPLRHGERELGIINVYIHEAGILQPDTQSFLQSLYDYTALALEVLGLRKQELAALGGISTFRKRTDLRSSLKELLVELSNALELETALIAIPSLDSGQNIVSASFDLDDAISIGKDFSEEDKEFVEAQIKASIAGKEDISLTNRKKQLPSRNALWITPLHFDDRSIPIGILAAVKGSGESIEQRHLTLVEMAANQAAHLIQAAQHFAEVEYKAMIEERIRLAREIHDGLAQTLGFLKLQLAQMQVYLDRGEKDRLKKNLGQCYQALSEAYQDAREAIDGLRMLPSGQADASTGLSGWLQQVVAEFQDSENLRPLAIELNLHEINSKIPSEVHAQLIRIVQEALSNIRKHAQASQVWITIKEKDTDLIVDIKDDGRGFSVDEIPGPSQHGLRGMRERAELVGADFQITSRPGEGTRITVRLPISEHQRLEI